ncbi:MAG: hypothetical protein JNM86_07680 [Phycisphaerae bacterium]|nr:hypothetical protein [Phycisphaerae bacterium]
MKSGVVGISVLLALAGVVVHGQPANQPVMKPVDAGIADVGPLSGPGRSLSPGLRQPSGFDRVYEVELNGKKYFARQNGSTVAVFPRSAYTHIDGRSTILIPAGTTFYLGGLPANARPVSPEEMAANYAGKPQNLAMPVHAQSTRIDLSAAAKSARGQMRLLGETLDLPPSAGSVWESEFYRVQRTGALIDAALAAQKRRGS